MSLQQIFGALPYGFSSFDAVKDCLLECRAKERLPQNAKTVISVLFPYYLGEDAYKDCNVSRYAVSEDYHIITKQYLDDIVSDLQKEYPGFAFEAFTDNSPLPEVRCAVNAGLGALGKNSLFIHPEYGSWVFLSEIVTDLYLEPFTGALDTCLGCDVCKKLCPVQAITEQGIRKESCLSYLTQKKGELSAEIKQKMIEYHCAWGCDICQKVCPMNKNAKITPIPEFIATANARVTTLDSIENRAFAWRGRAVIQRNLNAMEEE